MIKKAFLGLMVCAMLISSSAFANMLQNGSFEDPVVPEGSNFIEFPVLPNWTIANSIYYVTFKQGGFAPVDGLNEFYLFGGTATQNVGAITANTVYTLNFATGIPDGQTAIYSEIVLLSQYTDGGVVYTDRVAAINLGDVITTTNQLVYGTLSFDSAIYPWVAGRNMLVQISSGTMLHLDDFDLTAIPEPVTMVLMAAGLAMLRRKK
jgi:hypothetical protein